MAVAHNLLPRIIKSGLGVLPPAAGVAALAAVLRARAAPPAQVVVSPFEWPKLMAGADRVFPVRALALHNCYYHYRTWCSAKLGKVHRLRQAACKGCHFHILLLDSPDPCKTQSVVSTVLFIYTAPCWPWPSRLLSRMPQSGAQLTQCTPSWQFQGLAKCFEEPLCTV